MPAKSKSQQRFFGLVHAVQKGEQDAPSEAIADAATSMSKSDVDDFASTKHKALPEKKKPKKKKKRILWKRTWKAKAEKAACELLYG